MAWIDGGVTVLAGMAAVLWLDPYCRRVENRDARRDHRSLRRERDRKNALARIGGR